jgi:CBS domain-containing protein
MNVGDICNREVVFVNRDVTVHAACRLMRHYHVGSLVVVDTATDDPSPRVKHVPVGILTDRDIVVEVDAMELDARVITVGDIMSDDLVVAPESLSLAEAVDLMRFKGVRRLPVVNADSRLSGIVTIDDVLVVLAEALSNIAHVVSREPRKEAIARR